MRDNKYKICFVLDTAIGGITTVVLGQIKLLNSDDYECYVLLLNISWRNVSSSKGIFEKEGIKCIEISISQKINKYRLLKRMANIYLREADLIIASTKYEMTAYGLARLSTPLILMVHGDTDAVETMVIEFQDMADRIIAISEFIKEWALVNVRKGNRSKIFYLPHAIPIKTSLIISKDSSKTLNIIFIGRYNECKGADYLIGIGEKLQDAKEIFKFIFITDGCNEEDFRLKWPLNNVTSYYSNISNVQVLDLLCSADIILMPSRNEGLPIALIEAMRLGVVPVCSNLRSGFSELIISGENGYLVEVGDINRFVECILNLDRNRGILESMIEKSIEMVSANFDPNKNILGYDKMYKNVINNNWHKNYPIKYSSLGFLDSPFIPNWLFWFSKHLKIFIKRNRFNS